ncbi:hypothetical protein DIURU_004599 [Diutina rugosa]|uniref:Uncharacterized protein n=1 Tax=Diutina rugosa TaxID=5481 RepID=A0A642UIT7_DIURU|nr:uncharacterized protein DIURU_004599 [Diutina rugosa]KAA8898579.1 hypothetical protein DIURU_004599 [Diutina rugosa]
MTSLEVPEAQLPPVSRFQDTACPTPGFIDYNIHFAATDLLPDRQKSIHWPLSQSKAVFHSTYLHVGGESKHIPLHINRYYHQVATKDKLADESGIGANINALAKERGALGSAFTQLITPRGTKALFGSGSHNLKEESPWVSAVLESSGTLAPKVLVSVNTNIFNVINLNAAEEYAGTREIVTTRPLFPFQAANVDYRKIIEHSYARVVFTHTVTAMWAENSTVIIGFVTGDILILDLQTLTYNTLPHVGNASASSADPASVTALQVFHHPQLAQPFIIAGYANGEVAIFDPSAPETEYARDIVGTDPYITYFRKFDLSSWATRPRSMVVGHLKLSYHHITSIATTMTTPSGTTSQSGISPLLIAIGGTDGVIHIIDLMFTSNMEYGVHSPVSSPVVTDVVTNYFNDHVSQVKFTPDNKFLVVAGSSDLVEVFKMTYYNVDSLLNQRQRPAKGGRSRSNTASSVQTTGSVHPDTPRYPPTIKSIDAVARFKGHTNIVHRVDIIPGSAPNCYKIVSAGWDGKLMVWEFDYKALPKLKRKVTSEPRARRMSRHRSGHSPSPLHLRTRSEDGGTSPVYPLNNVTNVNNMASMLHPSGAESQVSSVEAPPEVVSSVYKSLFELRHKRHYKSAVKKHRVIVHSVADCKSVPMLEVALVDLDLSRLVPDGKIDNFEVTPYSIWCFTMGGDIYRYRIEQSQT